MIDPFIIIHFNIVGGYILVQSGVFIQSEGVRYCCWGIVHSGNGQGKCCGYFSSCIIQFIDDGITSICIRIRGVNYLIVFIHHSGTFGSLGNDTYRWCIIGVVHIIVQHINGVGLGILVQNSQIILGTDYQGKVKGTKGSRSRISSVVLRLCMDVPSCTTTGK